MKGICTSSRAFTAHASRAGMLIVECSTNRAGRVVDRAITPPIEDRSTRGGGGADQKPTAVGWPRSMPGPARVVARGPSPGWRRVGVAEPCGWYRAWSEIYLVPVFAVRRSRALTGAPVVRAAGSRRRAAGRSGSIGRCRR